MPLIPYPNIPAYPGVPALVRSANIPPVVTISLGLVQSILASALQSPLQWGIFDSKGNQLGVDPQNLGLGAALLQAAITGGGSVLSTYDFDFVKETRISNFPLEAGSFANFNKVEMPANPVVTLALAGSEFDRALFLNAIDAACKSTDLYMVVTPEVTYINYSLERYRYSRKAAKGATLLVVEISLEEIRQVSAAYTTATPIKAPKDTGAASQIDAGKVQPTAPDQSVLKSISNYFQALGVSQGAK
jgi:hypothetical protein